MTYTKFHKMAEDQGIPVRTLDEVRQAMREAHKQGAGIAMARIMYRHGRMTDEARAMIAREYPEATK